MIEEWKVAFLTRLILAEFRNPTITYGKTRTAYRDRLLSFLQLDYSSHWCGAGFRYNQQLCLKCGASRSLLQRTEHPLLNYCNGCTESYSLVTTYVPTPDAVAKDNLGVIVLTVLDPLVQSHILKKLFDIVTHPDIE